MRKLSAFLTYPLIIQFSKEPKYFFVIATLSLNEASLCDIIEMQQQRDESIP